MLAEARLAHEGGARGAVRVSMAIVRHGVAARLRSPTWKLARRGLGATRNWGVGDGGPAVAGQLLKARLPTSEKKKLPSM